MSTDEIMVKLTQILRDVLDAPELVVGPDTSAAAVTGWDSMKHILILMAVQDAFHIHLTTRELDRLRNVGDLATAVRRRIADRAAS